METGRRSILKAVIWQVMGLFVMVIIAYLYTGSWTAGSALGGINFLVGMCSYVIYERVWAKVSWGRIIVDESGI